IDPLELLERTRRLEDGVQMPDEQQLRAGTRMLGDEMPGPLEGLPVDPGRLEPECVELRAKDVADLPHSCEIHRAAVDVDEALQQRERFGIVFVDGSGDAAFLAGERRLRARRPERETGQRATRGRANEIWVHERESIEKATGVGDRWAARPRLWR